MTNTANTQSGKVLLPILIVVGAAIIGLGFYFLTGSEAGKDGLKTAIEDGIDTATDGVTGAMNDVVAKVEELDAPDGFPPMPDDDQADDTLDATQSMAEDFSDAVDEVVDTVQPVTTATELDVSAILAERAVGNPNAPVRIDEFASLTCGHCADFHSNTYDTLKAKFIDTGKVYFVFNDFPLDRAALDASITARCLPADKHESFLSLLFKTQRMWAAEGYMKSLRQNAKLAGLSDEEFDACHESEAVKKGLESNIKKARDNHDIQSTPTFILNNGQEIIRGSSSMGTFDQVITKLLAE